MPKILTVVHASAQHMRKRVKESLAAANAGHSRENPVSIDGVVRVSSASFREHLLRCIAAGEVRLRRTAHGPFYIAGAEAASVMQAYLLATGQSFVHEAETERLPPPRVSNSSIAEANAALLEKHLVAMPDDGLPEAILAACREARQAEYLRQAGVTATTADEAEACLVHDLRLERLASAYCAAAIEEMVFERTVSDALHRGLMPLHLMVARGRLDRALDFAAVEARAAAATAAQSA